MDDPHKLFWAPPDRRRLLIASMTAYRQAVALDDKVFASQLLGRTSADYQRPDKRDLNEILAGKKKHNWEKFSGLHLALCALIDDRAKTGNDIAPFADALAMREELTAFISRNRTRRNLPDEKAMEAFVDLLERFVEIDKTKFLTAKATFFSEDDKPDADGILRKRYELFRYIGAEGKIAKSFIVLRVLSYDVGEVCTFSNYFPVTDADGRIIDGKNNARVTRGIVVPTDRVVYFIGGIDRGMGLKIMAVNKTRQAPSYTGLLISFETDGAPVTARFVMKESVHELHDNAQLRIRPDDEFTELGNDLEKLKHPIKAKAAIAMWRTGE